jgi:hypothetical protein
MSSAAYESRSWGLNIGVGGSAFGLEAPYKNVDSPGRRIECLNDHLFVKMLSVCASANGWAILIPIATPPHLNCVT